MKAISGKRLCQALKAKGWRLERIHGSHYLYSKPGGTTILSVPVHGNQSLKVGLLKALLRQAGLREDEL